MGLYKETASKKITFTAVRQKIHVLKFIKPGVSLGNVDWSKYVRKKYNYIYTGDNVDIQNLKIDFKTAYFMRNIRPFSADEKEKGKFREFKDKFEEKLNNIFGAEDFPDIPLRQEVSVQHGKSTVTVDDPRMPHNQQFYDYLTNPQVDMMKIELTILGDPAYVCQDQFTNLTGTSPTFVDQGSWNSTFGSFNSESYQPLILLTYRLPNDPNVLTGDYFADAGKNRTMFFTGIYQVVKIESSISSGQFTQVLHGVRMNNQKGKGKQAIFGKEVKEHFKEQQKKADDKIKKNIENKKLERLECFHPEQLVGDKFMKDLQPGDDINGKEILGMMKLRLTGDMYSISNVRVTGSHGIKYKNEWIFVADHPDSVKINDKPEFVYIPLVETGTFTINNEEFADYDYHDIIVLGNEEWKRRRGFQEELIGTIN